MKRNFFVWQLIFLCFFVSSLGYFFTYRILGYQYQSNNYTKIMLFFQVCLLIIALAYYKKLKLDTLSNKIIYSNWIFPYMVAIYLILDSTIFTENLSIMAKNFLLLFFITFFSVFSEELIFRGILLPIMLDKYSVGRPILFNGILFSLFQLLRGISGVPINNLIMQMIYSLIYGINFACLMILINNVLPLIIYRTVWNICLMSWHSIYFETANLIFISIIMESIILLPLFFYVTIKKRREYRQ